MRLKIILLIIVLSLCSTAFAADYTLDIINVGEVGANNRIKFAYPGIEYNVLIAAEGGELPFVWSLTGNTTCGASINSSTGVITWASPSTDDTGCTIEAMVTDDESNTDTESYTVTVTASTDRFVFIDADYSGSESGTLSEPYNTLSDAWALSNRIVYLRDGTYTIAESIIGNDRNDNAVAYVANSSPVAVIGYPSETATIDNQGDRNASGSGCNGDGDYTNCHSYIFGIDGNDGWLDNLTIEDIHWYGTHHYGGDYAMIRRVTFTDADSYDCSGHNCAYIAQRGTDSTKDNWVISDNIIATNPTYSPDANPQISGIKLYDDSHGVIQRNTITAAAHEGISLKDDQTYMTVRQNTLKNLSRGLQIQYYGTTVGDLELSYNLSIDNSRPLDADTIDGDVYLRRNTFEGEIDISCDTGNFTITGMAIHSADADGVDADGSCFSVSGNDVASSGIFDSNGSLIDQEDVGTYGWELGDGGDTTPPTVSNSPHPTIAANGTDVTIAFSETVSTDNYDTGDFSLDCVIAGDPVNLTYSSGDDSSSVVFTVAKIGSTDSCTLDYDGEGDSAIEDAADNALEDFDTDAVTNSSTQDLIAPTMSSATVSANDGTTVTVVFDESVTTANGYDTGDLHLDCSISGGTTNLEYVSGNDSDTLVMTTGATTVYSVDVCNIDFSGGANEIEDTAGNDLVAEDDIIDPITNNSTQIKPPEALGITATGGVNWP